MVKVQATPGLREPIARRIPDPHGSIGDDQHVLGLAQPAVDGLAVELAHQSLDPESSADIASLTNNSPASGRLSSVIEPKHRAHIDPVPTRRYLGLVFGCLLSHGLRLTPVVAFTDVPSIDLDDECEGARGGLGLSQPLEAFPCAEFLQASLSNLLGLDPLSESLPVDEATREIQPETLGNLCGLLGWHLGPQ